MRQTTFKRETTETQISGALTIDGRGRYDIRTGIRFFDHMLELFTRHGGFDLTLKATGDLDVDQHHTVEDVGIVLGESLLKALGDRKGINRAGYFVMPMDETLAVVAVDLSGRPHASVDLKVKVRMVGDLQSELVHDFFDGFATGARANVHAKVLYGRSSHHHIEAVFKAFARALGTKRGINRAGYFVMPMDETLAVAAVDLGGRPHAVVKLKLRVRRVGDLQAELVHDFFDGFASGARANVHAKVLYGRSSHHHVEAIFKAFARALRVACARDDRLAKMLPSTKGLL